MRSGAMVTLALVLAAATPAALAQDRNPGPEAAPRGAAVQAPPLSAATRAGSTAAPAPVSGPAERDVSIQGYAPQPPCREIFSQELVRVGPATGDAEKDSLGRAVIGFDCR